LAHDVFVSYSSKDKAVSDTLVAALEKNNIRCWYAPRDIQPGADWGEAIATAINESSILLLIFSSNANQSRRVLDELNMAIAKEVIILPFRIEKLDPTGAMFLHLSSRHWLDAFVPSWEKHIDNLIKSVLSNLENGEAGSGIKQAKSFKIKKSSRWVFGVAGFIILFVIAAIFGLSKLLNSVEDSTSDLAPTETLPSATLTSTAISTPTAEAPALGSEENPILWMYIPNPDFAFNDVSSAAEEVAGSFVKKTDGLIIKLLPAPDTSAIIDALCANAVHIGSLGSFSYLSAAEQDCAKAKLIWSAYDDIDYGGMIFTNSASGISSIEELEGKSLCIPSYTSNSGWLLPSLEIKASIGDPYEFFGEIIEVGSHTDAVDAVYSGECYAGTAFYDARTTSSELDVNDHIIILSTTTSIPNLNLSFVEGIEPEIAQVLVDTLMDISTQSNALAIVSGIDDASGQKQLIEINDFYFNEFRDLFLRSGEDPKDYLSSYIYN